MVSLIEILRKRFLDTIRSVQPPGQWKVVVVDRYAKRLIDAVLSTYDILEENVTVVEEIESNRAVQSNFEAVYIVAPTRANVEYIIRDFSKATKQYSAAHLFLMSGMDDKTVQRLTASLDQYLLSFVELFVDFFPLEAQVFMTNSPQSFFALYNPDQRDYLDAELDRLANHLVCLCATLGEYPVIRYHRHLDEEHGAKSIPYKLAMKVQGELDEYCRNNPDFPPTLDPPRPRGVLLITDRTLDMFAPILHEFTYQAMVHDLLPIEDGGKYVYESEGGKDGEPERKEAFLDEKDQIWVNYRHVHMSEAITTLISDFNKFISENTNFSDSAKATSLDDMADMLTSLPQYKEMKEKYALHINLAQKCMNLFEKKKLPLTATIEQNCATGITTDGKIPKTLVEDMVPLLDDRSVSNFEKIRLLMCYIMYRDGLLDDDRRKLFSHARVSQSEGDAFNNLQMMGVRLSKNPGEKERKRKKPSNLKGKPDAPEQFELSRYVPVIKTIVEDHIKGVLDVTKYPYTKDTPEVDQDSISTTSSATAASSLRSARPMWHKSRSSVNEVRQRIIVFMAGGLTYSEMRSIYELSKDHGKDVIIGSTHTVTPKMFISDLKHLKRGGSRHRPIERPSANEKSSSSLKPGGGLGFLGGKSSSPMSAPTSRHVSQPPLPPRKPSGNEERNRHRSYEHDDRYQHDQQQEGGKKKKGLFNF